MGFKNSLNCMDYYTKNIGMDAPKPGDTITVKTPTGQFIEGIADVEKPNVRPLKGEIHITVYTQNQYQIHSEQYSIVFKDGTESNAVCLAFSPTNIKGRFRALLATTIPQ